MELFRNSGTETDLFINEERYDNMELNFSTLPADLSNATESEVVDSDSIMEAECDSIMTDIPYHTEAVKCIEDVIISFLEQIAIPERYSTSGNEISENFESEQDESSLNIKNNPRHKIEIRLADRTKQSTDGSTSFKYIKYPRKSARGSAKPLAQLLRVLDLTHEAVLGGVPATKRDIYYKDVALFKTQKCVDSLVDDLAATFELERSDLNIRATSKGLVTGAGLTIHLLSGETLRLNDTEGALIPVGEDILSFSVDRDVSWVLIVEKEAVFQTFCRLGLITHPSMSGRGIMITGKGYPDMATRHLVKSLADALPRRIPIMALVDGDPYGLDIISVYKYGSTGLQHENSKLAARRVKWLGLWASELESFGIERDKLLPITKHDEKKAFTMLRRSSSTLPAKWKKELMYILHNRKKAEIEILSTAKRGICENDTEQFISSKTENQSYCSSNDSNPITSADTTEDNIQSPGSYASSQSSASISSSLLSATRSISESLTSQEPSPSPALQAADGHLIPHELLVRYITSKVSEAVSNAQARANAIS